MPKKKTKAIDFAGTTRLWIEDGKIQIVLSGGGLAGSHCATVKADGVMGKAVEDHIRTELLAAIPGASFAPSPTRRVTYERERLVFNLELSYAGPVPVGSLTSEHLDLTWNEKIDPETIAVDLIALSAIRNAMGWSWMRLNVVTHDPDEVDLLRSLMQLETSGIDFSGPRGTRMIPARWGEEIVLAADLFTLAPSDATDGLATTHEVIEHLGLSTVPVLLDVSVCDPDFVGATLDALRSRKDLDLSRVRLIRHRAGQVTLWDGRWPNSVICADVVFADRTLEIRRVREASQVEEKIDLANWHDTQELVHACQHLGALNHWFDQVKLIEQPAQDSGTGKDQQVLVPARTLMEGDSINLSKSGEQANAALIRSAEFTFSGPEFQTPVMRLRVSWTSALADSFAIYLGVEEQVRLISRAGQTASVAS